MEHKLGINILNERMIRKSIQSLRKIGPKQETKNNLKRLKKRGSCPKNKKKQHKHTIELEIDEQRV